MNAQLSWNRLPRLKAPSSVHTLDSPFLPDDISVLHPFTIQGNARSYGDICLTDKGTLLLGQGLDQFISFDRNNGILRCYAGVKLADILALIVPQGWFLPTTPGTALVTVGGAIANDVHGKNHHVAGSFGHHILQMELLRSNGERTLVSPLENKELFSATIGGLGLTGLITWVELQMIPIKNCWMQTESRSFRNLQEYWDLNAQMQLRWPYSVSWVDCLSEGRGVMFLGQHAAAQDDIPNLNRKNLNFPCEIPFSLVNNISVNMFNRLYFYKNKKNRVQLSTYESFFYPLDGIYNWNRMYGRHGFFQYQCVFPKSTERSGIKALFHTIKNSHQGSFLAVLKTFGDLESLGLLSFPRAGTTLALDFPNKGQSTLKLFNEFDAIVREYQGALYPAKDARMPKEMFRHSFPNWEDFALFIDPKFSSHFWERITS